MEKAERDIFHLGLKEVNDTSEVINHVYDLEQALDDKLRDRVNVYSEEDLCCSMYGRSAQRTLQVRRCVVFHQFQATFT